MSAPNPRPTTLQLLRSIVRSRRLGAVVLLSFSSGLPLGLLLIAMPAWLAFAHVDIKTIGLLALAQVPYSLKFLWSPIVDRWSPGLGRRRGWIALTQLLLAVSMGVLGTIAGAPTLGVVAGLALLIAFASATQDIAYDAYSVDALLEEEQGVAIGARVAMYRLAMWVGGNIAISLAPWLGWDGVMWSLAGIYVLLLPVTLFFAPEPAKVPVAPTNLATAIWEPLVSLLRVERALEIAAFVVLYKLADNLAGALVRPFLAEIGFDPIDVGVASGTIGLIGTLVGTFVGGALTPVLGIGRALWIFGVLQAVSNLGYVWVASVGPERTVLYVAMAVESGTSGLGTGAFGVLLMRLTRKRFSATQYALLSSLFALGRTFAGPLSGALVDAIGWRDFFLVTIPAAIPGLLFLQRFVPFGTRDLPAQDDDATDAKASHVALPTGAIAGWLAAGGLLGTALGAASTFALSGLRIARADKVAFDVAVAKAWALFTSPESAAQQTNATIDAVSILAFGLVAALGTAAYVAARGRRKAA